MARLKIARRRFLMGGALAGAAGAASAATVHDGELGAPPETFRGGVAGEEGGAVAPPAVSGANYVFFSKPELAFVTAAVDRLIPKDPTGPSASEAGVPFFLDRQ